MSDTPFCPIRNDDCHRLCMFKSRVGCELLRAAIDIQMTRGTIQQIADDLTSDEAAIEEAVSVRDSMQAQAQEAKSELARQQAELDALDLKPAAVNNAVSPEHRWFHSLAPFKAEMDDYSGPLCQDQKSTKIRTQVT